MNLSEYMDIGFLVPEKCSFSITEAGVVSLKNNNDIYKLVSLYRAFPFSEPDKYIIVKDEKNKEIGIINDLLKFDEKSRTAVEYEIRLRYFTPVITKLISIKEEFGFHKWETVTDSGKRSFVIKSGSSSLKLQKKGSMLIEDVNGCRYQIKDFENFNTKYKRVIETLL